MPATGATTASKMRMGSEGLPRLKTSPDGARRTCARRRRLDHSSFVIVKLVWRWGLQSGLGSAAEGVSLVGAPHHGHLRGRSAVFRLRLYYGVTVNWALPKGVALQAAVKVTIPPFVVASVSVDV